MKIALWEVVNMLYLIKRVKLATLLKTGCLVKECCPKNKTEMTGFKFEVRSDGSIPLEQVPQVVWWWYNYFM